MNKFVTVVGYIGWGLLAALLFTNSWDSVILGTYFGPTDTPINPPYSAGADITVGNFPELPVTDGADVTVGDMSLLETFQETPVEVVSIYDPIPTSLPDLIDTQIRVVAEVDNPYDPESTPEEPQMSMKIDHQRDLLNLVLGR